MTYFLIDLLSFLFYLSVLLPWSSILILISFPGIAFLKTTIFPQAFVSGSEFGSRLRQVVMEILAKNPNGGIQAGSFTHQRVTRASSLVISGMIIISNMLVN